MNKISFFKWALSKANKEKVRYFIDFIYFAIGFFFATFLSMLISIQVNRNLVPEELGRLAYNKSILELSAFIFSLTLHRSYLRFNVNGISSVVKQLTSIVVKFAVILVGIVAYYLTNSWLPVLFSLFVLYEERIYFARSIMRIRDVNLLKIGAALITLCFIFVISKYGNLNSNKVLFAYGLGFLLSLVFYRKEKSKIVHDRFDLPIKTVLLFALPGLISLLIKYSLDASAQVLLKSFFDFSEVAKFAIALRVMLAIKLFSALLMMFYPTIYYREIQTRNKRFIFSLRAAMVLIMFLISTAAYIFAKPLYILMGASAYIDYVEIFHVLIIAEFIFIIGNFWGTYLSFALKTHISMFIFGAGALINLFLLVAFLQRYGVYLAAWSILISNVVMTFLFIFLSLKPELKYLNINS